MNGTSWWLTPGGIEYYESDIHDATVTASKIEFEVLNGGVLYLVHLEDKGNGWWSGHYQTPRGKPQMIGGRVYTSTDNTVMFKGTWKETNQYSWIFNLS